MTFYGNPNAKITAIDTSGGITCSRTSGQTPCPIQVSAGAITCTGTIVDTAGNVLAAHSVAPTQDLEFSWDFGDPGSTDTLVVRGGPRRGQTVDTNSGQIGHMAVHWYRSAGTYTITLTIRGKNGSGFTTATKTQNVTVTTFNPSAGTWYFDSAAAGGGDGSIGAPFNTVAQITTKAVRNTQLWIKAGSSWDGTDGIDISRTGFGNGPLRIGKYGTGANPKVRISSGTNLCLKMDSNGSGATTYVDIVVSDIDFERGGSKTLNLVLFLISNPNATISDIYLDGCNLVSDNTSGDGGYWITFQWSTDGSLVSNFGIRGGSITATATDTAKNVGFFGGARNWNFFSNISNVTGTGGNALLDHHFYPDCQNYNLFQGIKFGSGPTRNYCLNCNWDTISGALETAQHWLISECEMTGTDFAHDGSDATGHTDKVRFSDFVCERNDIHDLNQGGALFYNIISYTNRDNRSWNVKNSSVEPAANQADNLLTLFRGRIYRNYEYRASNPNGQPAYEFVEGGHLTLEQQITDNVIQDALTAAKCIGVYATDQQSAGSLIDRNQYWIPNDADSKGWYDNTTAKTFAQWNAFGFDVNGLVADPIWLDPANGDFTPFRRRVRLTATA